MDTELLTHTIIYLRQNYARAETVTANRRGNERDGCTNIFSLNNEINEVVCNSNSCIPNTIFKWRYFLVLIGGKCTELSQQEQSKEHNPIFLTPCE